MLEREIKSLWSKGGLGESQGSKKARLTQDNQIGTLIAAEGEIFKFDDI